MANFLNDLSVVLSGASQLKSISGNDSGTGLDFLQADGRCQAAIGVGALGGTSPTVTFVIEESDDNSTFTAVTNLVGSLATFSTQNTSRIVSFDRTKRYVRTRVTTGGTSPTAVIMGFIFSEYKTY